MESAPTERLRPCRVCEGLSNREIERVAAACSWRTLLAEETLTFPGDSVFAIYTVTRGRLRMYRSDIRGGDTSVEKFIGYANLGDTIGQSSLLSDQFDDDSRIVADADSQVAVLSRGRAMRLIFEIPRFRENLVVAFGVRMESLLEGKPPRRFPKVVGIVSSESSKRSLRVLPLLGRELRRRGERVSIFSDRENVDVATSKTMVTKLSEASDPSAGLLSRVREQLAYADRVLVDVVLPRSATEIAQLIRTCDETFWCCDNDHPAHDSEAILTELVSEQASFSSRLVCVQLFGVDRRLGRKKPCCGHLVQRDFMLPLSDSGDHLTRLEQQGIDRIVRHLRGVKIGLAFGGGGARGLAHLGVLKVLDRAGINFDLMSGTSAGAMIGLGYAAGLSPDTLIDLFASELQPPMYLDRIPGGRRLFLFMKFRARAWEQLLRKHYHDWQFEQLAIPFSVVTTDLVSGEEMIRDRGDLVTAILESINIPVLSSPILKDGKVLVDGGVLNNLPAELLTDNGAQKVIGVDVSKEIPNHFAGNHSQMTTKQMRKPGNVETAHRIMEVSRRGITQLQMSFADQVIEPDTSAFDFADFTAAEAIAQTGEAAAERVLPDIQKMYDELVAG